MLIQLHKNEGILQKRWDIAVASDGHLQITNVVDRQPRSDFIIDVKVFAMVTGDGDWKALWNADKTVLENHTLTHAEDVKFRKHETNYAAVGLAFFPLLLGCFGGIGSQAPRFLCTLAFLELRQHDALCERAGLARFLLLIAPSFALGVFSRRLSSFASFTYLPSSSPLCFQLPRPC